MSTRIASAFVEISTRQQKLYGELGQARQGIRTWLGGVKGEVGKGLGEVFSGVLGGVGIGAGLGAFSSVVGVLEHVIEKSREAESSQTKLAATLRATGNEVPQNAARINELADALREGANVSPELTRSLASLGLNLGIGTQQINSYVRAAIGLAEATGSDETSAMEKLIKASEGSFKALEKQLPILKQLHTAEEKFAYVQTIARQGLQERHAQLDTVGGSMRQLSLAMDELSVATGKAIAPTLVAFAKEATAAMKLLTVGTFENADAAIELHKQWLSVKGVFTSLPGSARSQQFKDEYDALTKQQNILLQQKIAADNKAAAEEKGTHQLNAQVVAGEKLKKQAEKLHQTFSDAAEVWKRAQEMALNPGGKFGTFGKGQLGAAQMAGAGSAAKKKATTKPAAQDDDEEDEDDGSGPTTRPAKGSGSATATTRSGAAKPAPSPGSQNAWNSIGAAIGAVVGRALNGQRGRVGGMTAEEEYRRLKDERDQLASGRANPKRDKITGELIPRGQAPGGEQIEQGTRRARLGYDVQTPPNEAAQKRIEKINQRMLEINNQIRGEGGVHEGQAHRTLELLKDKLDEAVRKERMTPQQAEEILRKRKEALNVETTVAPGRGPHPELFKQTLDRLATTLMKLEPAIPKLVDALNSPGRLK